MKIFLLTILLLLFCGSVCAPTEYLSLNLDSQLLRRTNFYLNVLASEVRTYNWIYCNKLHLYWTVITTSNLLHQIKQAVALGCSNQVQGNDNVVLGKGNVVIGSKNQVIGYNNWVFVSGYTSAEDGKITVDEGVLVIGKYKIELCKIELIKKNPSLAISMIDSSELDELKSKNKAVSYFFSQ